MDTLLRFFTLGLLIINTTWAVGIIPSPTTTIASRYQAQLNLIQSATHHAVTISRHFDSGVPGVTGFVIHDKTPHTHPLIAYVDHNAHYMMIGALLNAKGVNLNYRNTQRYIMQAEQANAYQDVTNTTTFVEGKHNAPHKLTIIADPNCSFCHRFYTVTRPFVHSGQLAIRWLLVGFLKPTSAKRAALIIGATHPVAALAQNEQHFNGQIEEGGLPLSGALITPAMTKAIATNNAYFSAHHFSGTPVLLYRTKHNPHILSGFVNQAQLRKRLPTIDGGF